MSNNSMSDHLTSNYTADTIRSFEIEIFDIEQRERPRKGREDQMDAVTSFELEARRRRETVVNDRDHDLARAKASTEPVEADAVPSAVRNARPRSALPAQGDCQPTPLARQSAG
jgi:hypothetical protein